MKRFFVATLLLVSCSSSSAEPTIAAPDDAGTTTPADDAGTTTTDAAAEAAAPALDGGCASTFGDKLTDGFGRIDGVVYALQMPNDQTCTFPNSTHLIVQVLMNGAVYRMVTNTDVKVLTVDHALPAPAFGEGWHTGVSLDYPSNLDAHSTSFVTKDMAGVVSSVTEELHVGDPVSVYATSQMRPESAHLVHRNPTNTDGAIVVHPTSATPKFILFCFDNQTF